MKVRNWDFAKWETQKVELGKCVFSTELIFSLIFGTSRGVVVVERQHVSCHKWIVDGRSSDLSPSTIGGASAKDQAENQFFRKDIYV